MEWAAAVVADLGRAIGDPRFPGFAAIVTAPPDGKNRTMEESFDFGLQRVLDGVEMYVEAKLDGVMPLPEAAPHIDGLDRDSGAGAGTSRRKPGISGGRSV